MTSLLILVPIAMLLVGLAIALYIWAINDGQYLDLDRESSQILFDKHDSKISKSPGNGRVREADGRITK